MWVPILTAFGWLCEGGRVSVNSPGVHEAGLTRGPADSAALRTK